jgi:S1-C subfamily serine protease
VTLGDVIAIGFVLLAAFVGMRKGLIASSLSLVGIAVGAIIGARLAPHLLSNGDTSPYTPLAALAGAALLAVLFETLGTLAGGVLRSNLRIRPLKTIDTAGGLLVGAVAALAIVWVVGAVALQLPGQTKLRRGAQRSFVLRELNGVVPPSSVLKALSRVDPFPAIAAPVAPIAPPNPQISSRPGVKRAARSVVRVIGNACGLAVEGSGWVARPGLVVTAAHVIAGQHDTEVQAPGEGTLHGRAVAFDPHNDVAVLRVAGLTAPPLPFVRPETGTAVAIVGYPENGPFDATPGRIGQTSSVLTQDAYGRGPVLRTITAIRGKVRHGNSGGPAVDAKGRVETTVFAARVGASGGYGVPDDPVAKALEQAGGGAVSTGGCVS